MNHDSDQMFCEATPRIRNVAGMRFGGNVGNSGSMNAIPAPMPQVVSSPSEGEGGYVSAMFSTNKTMFIGILIIVILLIAVIVYMYMRDKDKQAPRVCTNPQPLRQQVTTQLSTPNKDGNNVRFANKPDHDEEDELLELQRRRNEQRLRNAKEQTSRDVVSRETTTLAPTSTPTSTTTSTQTMASEEVSPKNDDHVDDHALEDIVDNVADNEVEVSDDEIEIPDKVATEAKKSSNELSNELRGKKINVARLRELTVSYSAREFNKWVKTAKVKSRLSPDP